MRATVLVAAMWMGCAPPPAVDVVDSSLGIDIVYPPRVDPEGGPFRVFPNEDGDFLVPVVVDLPGLTLVDPYTDPPPETAEGEGHWHIDGTEGSTVVTFDRQATFRIAGDEVSGDELIVLTVTLRANDHSPLELDDGASEDAVEIQLATP